MHMYISKYVCITASRNGCLFYCHNESRFTSRLNGDVQLITNTTRNKPAVVANRCTILKHTLRVTAHSSNVSDT